MPPHLLPLRKAARVGLLGCGFITTGSLSTLFDRESMFEKLATQNGPGSFP